MSYRYPTMFAALAMSLCQVTARAEDCVSLAQMDWVVGDWRSEVETTLFTEHWRRMDDGSLHGEAESRSTETGEVFISEKLRLEERSGRLTYVADVSTNDQEILFPLVGCDGDSVIFENPEHDFPKRIRYLRNGPDEISAHITDLEDKGFKLHFTRDGDSP